MSKVAKFDASKLERLLTQRFFYDQSFGIYGGVQGLYDYGPVGCAIERNLLSFWHSFFVLEDDMLEVKCSELTPERVLKASGHVDRFTDYMVKDSVTGDSFRADHLVEHHLEKLRDDPKCNAATKTAVEKHLNQLDNYGAAELQSVIEQFTIKAESGNPLTPPQQFNLMFPTTIGPAGNIKAYLRPETAQGIFVNFNKLLDYNKGKLPFSAAQVGRAFRNEISPRQGIIRVREFTMAEIEHFVDPDDKSHPKFTNVSSLKVPLYAACDQMDGKGIREVELGEAVRQGTINNETLGYFMGRIYQFLLSVGIQRDKFRFRQHLSNEMAHYASDCWDAECHTSYGWIECVGCADRACYDLHQHNLFTGVNLSMKKKLDSPKKVNALEAVPDKKLIGPAFKADAKSIYAALAALSIDDVKKCEEKAKVEGKFPLTLEDHQIELSQEMVKFNQCEKTVHTVDVVPNVIEPSFGIGRIMYCLFEHNFRVRDGDEDRGFISLPAVVAPYKCSVLQLSTSKKDQFAPLVQKVAKVLTDHGISKQIDTSSASIGKRYARTDEIGIPFGITIDFDSIATETVTLRERETMQQVRLSINELPKIILDLSNQRLTWAEVTTKYPVFEQQETANGEN